MFFIEGEKKKESKEYEKKLTIVAGGSLFHARLMQFRKLKEIGTLPTST